MMKKLLCLLLAVLLLAGLGCTAFADSGVAPGDMMPAFEVTLSDGTTTSLAELLQDHDLVVLNVFATWCGPCKIEFPEMEKSYQAHSDRMVILSVSGDPSDTQQMIADYKEQNGLSFPMGMAGDALDFLNVTAFPTTVFIGSDGKVDFYKVGAFVQEGEFEERVSTLLSDSYDGTPLPSEIAQGGLSPLILGGIVLAAVFILLGVIGRWRLLSKAGRPGWHSLIPILNIYQEYNICWKGWLGLVSLLCTAAAGSVMQLGRTNGIFILMAILGIAGFVLHVMESLRLAKAYGKGTGTGILLVIFRNLGRFFLGIGKAQYQGKP